jgi:adenylate cyclase
VNPHSDHLPTDTNTAPSDAAQRLRTQQITTALRQSHRTLMVVDVVESMRLIAQDEVLAVARIRDCLQAWTELIAASQQGLVHELRGDGFIAVFDTARVANEIAQNLHRNAAERNRLLQPSEQIAIRIGIHCSAVLMDDKALYGHGINLTARLASLGKPGETTCSAEVRDQLIVGLDTEVLDLGECYLKHVAEPVRAFRLLDEQAPKLNLPTTDLRTALAVLPFSLKNAGNSINPADCLSDQLTQLLAHTSNIRIISPLSAQAFRGREYSNLASERLAADYVLTGDCSLQGTQLSVAVQLRERHKDNLLWQDHFSGAQQAVLSADGDLVREIAEAVAAALLTHNLRAARLLPMPNLPSYTLYLSAIALLHRFSMREFDRALDLLQALQERAPRQAAPLAWRARWHIFRVVQAWSPNPQQDGEAAYRYASEALEHEPDSALAHTMLGSVKRSVQRDFDAAQTCFDAALAINPNEPLAWLFKGTIHGLRNESQPAGGAISQALGLSPLDPMRYYYDSLCATASTGSERYADAIVLAQRAIRANKQHASSYRTMAIAQGKLGQWVQARDTIERLLLIEPTASVAQFLNRVDQSSALNLSFAATLAEAGLPAGKDTDFF